VIGYPVLKRLAETYGESRFDCLIARDILRYSDDPLELLAATRGLVKEGGVLFLSLTGVAPVQAEAEDRWRFTKAGARHLFARVGGFDLTHIEPCGSLRAATAVLHGLGCADLEISEVDRQDPRYPVEIMVRAVAGS
jgi:hypothetical protein